MKLLARLLDHFGMNMRSLVVCSVLLLFAAVAYGAGSYQRTRDGKTLVWSDSTKSDEEATWSGKRDKDGFATGSGTLTWYKVEPTIVTGSHIPDARRHAVLIGRFSGKMVQGKFQGAITYIDARGERFPLALAPTPAVTAISDAEQARTPQESATPTPERTPARAAPTATPTPTPEQSPSPPAVAQQSAAEQTATPQSTATPMLEQQAAEPSAQSTIVPTPTPPDDSLRSPSAPPSASPKQIIAAASPKTRRPLTPPSPTPDPQAVADAQAVAALDTVYQAAVKDNDIAIMDRILADDFVLITGRGTSLTKADLIKEAEEKRTTYEHQEEEEGTQKVRVWGDTAVVTALLRVKGTRDQHPFDYEAWFSDTYARTPTGWRHIFGQASIPLPKPDTK